MFQGEAEIVIQILPPQRGLSTSATRKRSAPPDQTSEPLSLDVGQGDPGDRRRGQNLAGTGPVKRASALTVAQATSGTARPQAA